ncbi:hypothetical protein F3I62_19045 [Pseudomonas sp. R-28-1W-6]|uniref:hypothetical protein n=1 Tax=Pseudomonas sp. R-28-1W-6 TaxID=2650101 RepID=UPI00136645A0|nr:hypothetical protein [Pseudomonas sp. R-28-1W-6]MWV14203.1 hypothetical protein [Pseudomonas sp. R-28-1W-6]
MRRAALLIACLLPFGQVLGGAAGMDISIGEGAGEGAYGSIRISPEGMAMGRGTCSIEINKALVERDYQQYRYASAEAFYEQTMMHELVHCNHAPVLYASLNQLVTLAMQYQKTHGGDEPPVEALRNTHAEAFVGAYFLALSHADQEQSDGADIWWGQELRLSQDRGLGHSFEAIAAQCAKRGDCPTDIPHLNNLLLNDPEYRKALMKDLEKNGRD